MTVLAKDPVKSTCARRVESIWPGELYDAGIVWHSEQSTEAAHDVVVLTPIIF